MKAHKDDLNRKLKEANYKFLGWQNGWKSVLLDWDGNIVDRDSGKGRMVGYTKEDHPEYRNCVDQKHKLDNCQHSPRGSENTVSCDICKIYWKYDCSD